MGNIFQISQFTIVAVANRHNPSILNPDFLKHNNIVPKEWELKQAPICVEPFSEVAFKNDINIRAETNKLTFFEKISKKPLSIQIDNIAKKYTKILPHVDHVAVGLNFTGHVPYENDPEGPKRYIVSKFIADGPWCEYGDDRTASVAFTYTLGRTQLNLNIKESSFTIDKNRKIPVLLFESNFHKELIGNSKEEKLQDLQTILDNWSNDFEEFEKIVINIFLKET